MPFIVVSKGYVKEENENDTIDYHLDYYIQLLKMTRLQEIDARLSISWGSLSNTSPRFKPESGLWSIEGT